MNDNGMCRLCLHGKLKIEFALERAPKNIQHLLTSEEVANDGPIRLEVALCQTCGFVQLPQSLSTDYYDDYLMATTHSSQMQEYQRNQAFSFIRRFNLTGKKVLEAGSGDGSFLDHLTNGGALAFGVEPSTRFRDASISNGHRVEPGYVGASRRLPSGPFDGFVTRQVLEHVPDIHDFLSGIHHNVSVGAVGLIEVPSLEKAISDGRFYDIFADHVNYFTLETLGLAMRMNGFDVLHSEHGMFEEYNVMLVRKQALPNMEFIQAASRSLVSDLQGFFDERQINGLKTAVWGAGGKGLSLLASAGIDFVDKLVDSDPHKQGRYTPVSHLLVEAPSPAAFHGIDAVVITAMAYRNEIEETLRNQFGFRGVIAVLGHRLEVSVAQ